jgi:type IV pilus assembly protein PilA
MKTIAMAAVMLAGCSHPQDEAIQNVKEIAAAAKAHFDKTGKLCGSAMAVPAVLASVAGTRYALTADDFNTTDAETGWKCLGWKPSQSTIGYMLDYRAFGSYVTGGMVGAPDPGAYGFEASAQGDLDGDMLPSTFAAGGTVTSAKLTLAEVWSHEPAE